jgi:DNA-binding NtrC family response regulator
MSPSVLVVDDNVGICRILQLMLSNEAYEVKTCHSVLDALSAVEQKAFTVYVLDWKLSDGNGFEVAERVRSKWGQTPIILISGYDRSVTASKAEKIGISEFIEKPFSQEAFSRAVRKGIELAASAAPSIPPNQVAELKRKNLISRLWHVFDTQ